MKPFRSRIAVAASVLLAIACSDGTGSTLPAVDDVVFDAIPDTIGVGDTLRIIATPRDSADVALANLRVTWRSLAPAIATVDSAGLLTARDSGDAPIVVTAHGRTRVEDTVVARVRWVPRTVELSASRDSMLVSSSDVRLAVTAVALDGRGNPVGARIVWSSSDSSVAIPDTLGRVLPLNLGTAWIRAAAGGATDSIRLRSVYRRELPGFTRLLFSINSGYASAACGLDADGTAYCWNGTTSGTLADQSTLGAGPNPTSTTPALVSGGHTFKDLSVGREQACALAGDGTLYCWGLNTNGVFGHGALTPARSDVPLAGAPGVRFSHLELGVHSSACATSAADSVVYCWGGNHAGQVGRLPAAEADSRVAPVQGSLKATRLDVGYAHACAIAIDGATWCWGSSGHFDGSSPSVPTAPREVAPGGTYVQVAAGDGFTCGLRADGAAACFGSIQAENGSGMSPVPRSVSGGLRFVQLVAGMYPGACGLTAGGELHCWTVLDAGVRGKAMVPRHVMPGRTFVAATLNINHSCAMSMAHEVYCW